MKLTDKLDSLLPLFITLEYPEYSKFVEYYLEWLGELGPVADQRNINQYLNIDDSPDMFLEFIREEFMPTMEKLTSELDERQVIKYIKDFYRAKGSEQATKLLFRLLYNESIDFYYPGVDILRASDGRWVIKKSIKVRYTGNITSNTILNTIRLRGRNSNASARIDEVVVYTTSGVRINEIYITEIKGDFVHDEYIEDYDTNEVIGIITSDGVTTYPGVWEGTFGFLSSDKYLQDNDYYQEFSYVIKSPFSVNEYRDVVQRHTHPLGTKMFGQVSIDILLSSGDLSIDVFNAGGLFLEYLTVLDDTFTITINEGVIDGGFNGRYVFSYILNLPGVTKDFYHSADAGGQEVNGHYPVTPYISGETGPHIANTSEGVYNINNDIYVFYNDFIFEDAVDKIYGIMDTPRLFKFNSDKQPDLVAGDVLEIYDSTGNQYIKIENFTDNRTFYSLSDYRFSNTDMKQYTFSKEPLTNSSTAATTIDLYDMTYTLRTGTGSLTTTSNSSIITGTATLFTQELRRGDIIEFDDFYESKYFVSSITNNTILTLNDTYPDANTGLTYKYKVI